MTRRLHMTTRMIALLALATFLVVPTVGSACELGPASQEATDCGEACAELGYMPLDCAQQMPEGGCGDMSAPDDAAGSDEVVSSAAQQAPAFEAAATSEPLSADAASRTLAVRSARVERPPLDPLGTRLLI